MKLDMHDDSLIFSNTVLPDVFFTEYFSQASSDAIKVYLYLFFLSKYNNDIRINDLAKKLSLPFKAIQDSIKYWETQGLLIRKSSGYEIANLQEIELNKLYKPKINLSADHAKQATQNQYRSKAIESINNEFFQGVMSPSWYTDIDLWFSKYSFDEEVMIALFRQCFERSALHKNYVQTVAEAWAKNNIKTFADLEAYYEKRDKVKEISKTIARKLGISRQLSQYELGYVEKWVIDYDYDLNIIEIALKKTTSRANPSFDYLDTLITSWKERGLKTPEEVQTFIAEMNKKNKTIENMKKSRTPSYNNYNQRTYEDFSSLYATSDNVANPKEIKK